MNISFKKHSLQTLTRLPDHLVASILENLNVPDRARATLVCKSWKNLLTNLPTRDDTPWLITSNDTYDNRESFLTEIHFKSLSEERTYHFKLPNPYGDQYGGGWLCGSSRGWLLIATGLAFEPNMFIWNPISGSIRKLPPFWTLPCFHDFVKSGQFFLSSNISFIIPRMDVMLTTSTLGHEECVVAAIFRNPDSDVLNGVDSDVLALCTPHDKAWTVFRGDEKARYVDILFHDGKLHALTDIVIHSDDESHENDNMKDAVANDTIRLSSDCEVGLQRIFLYTNATSLYNGHTEEDGYDDEAPLGFSISKSHSYCVEHLVECSITGQLLCVKANYELCKFNNDIGQLGPAKSFAVYQLADFMISSMKQAPLMYEVMSSLGDQTVYVGTTGSVAVVNGGGDRIYFAMDETMGVTLREDVYMVREQGVFDVEKNTIRRSPRNLWYPLESKIGWFTPRLS